MVRIKPHIGFGWEFQEDRDHKEDRCKWQDNIKIDLTEIGCDGMDCTHLAEDRDL
jgi:hypothetical protein